MTREQIMVALFEFSAPTFYKWTKKEKRKIFDLINYAFDLDELEAFLTTNRIEKIEFLKENNLFNKEQFELKNQNKSSLEKQEENNHNNIKVNDILLEKTKVLADSFGLTVNSYIESLIIEDLKKQKL